MFLHTVWTDPVTYILLPDIEKIEDTCRQGGGFPDTLLVFFFLLAPTTNHSNVCSGCHAIAYDLGVLDRQMLKTSAPY
jgi:hypothetical protein